VACCKEKKGVWEAATGSASWFVQS